MRREEGDVENEENNGKVSLNEANNECSIEEKEMRLVSLITELLVNISVREYYEKKDRD